MYTSYFAKIKWLPEDFVPISICAKAPNFYKGLAYKKLAPSYGLLMDWKRHKDDYLYTRQYQEEVLDKLNAQEVLEELTILTDSANRIRAPKICLVCYEKSTDFCHRHLVAEWLTCNGVSCAEYIF